MILIYKIYFFLFQVNPRVSVRTWNSNLPFFFLTLLANTEWIVWAMQTIGCLDKGPPMRWRWKTSEDIIERSFSEVFGCCVVQIFLLNAYGFQDKLNRAVSQLSEWLVVWLGERGEDLGMDDCCWGILPWLSGSLCGQWKLIWGWPCSSA